MDAAEAAAAYQMGDSLTSLVNGMANPRDRVARSVYIAPFMDRTQLAYAYRGDWIARKGVDIPAFDMTRAGRDWQAEDDQIEAIEREEKRIGLWPKVLKALKLARLYGGSAIILGVGQGQPFQPLRPNGVGIGGLKYLHVVDRYKLHCGPLNGDPADPLFGQPTWYQLHGNRRQVTIHPSRVITFHGAEAPDAQGVDEFWGDSVLLALDQAIKNATVTQQGIAQLVGEAKVDVVKFKNLSAIAKSEVQTAGLLRRMALAKDAKDLYSLMIMDSEEEYEQKSITFAQLPEVARLFLSVAAGAFDIPATRFLSQSPDGMNSTGESDMKNYHDRIGADQTFQLRPALERLDDVLLPSALGSRPEGVYFEFAPLSQLSEKDKAEVFVKKTTGLRNLVGTGGMSPEIIPVEAVSDAAVNTFIEDGSMPGLEAAIEEHGRLSEQEPSEAELAAAAGVEPANDQPQAQPQRQRAANDRVLDAIARAVVARDAANPAAEVARLADAKPRPLYVSRPLVNAAEFLAWARSQGFDNLVPAEKLHVTLMQSRTPVDWMKMGESWNSDDAGNLTVKAGGPRVVEPLGDHDAPVLMFTATELQWRHQQMVAEGAVDNHGEFIPHVTISYERSAVDLSKVEPYRGKLVFGPERFEEYVENWRPTLIAAE